MLWRDIMTMETLIKKNFKLGLTYSQRFIPLLFWWETWQHTGKWGAGEGAKHFTSELNVTASKLCVILSVTWAKQASKPNLMETHFLKQGHTYSNKAIPPTITTSYGGHFHSRYHSLLPGQHTCRHTMIQKNKTKQNQKQFNSTLKVSRVYNSLKPI